MFLITGFDCGGAGVLRIIKFIFILLDMAFFLIPMGLILMMTVDIAKNVISGKEDEMKKNLNIAIKRLIYCVALFLVPTIVDFAIGLVSDIGVEKAECIDIAKTHELSQYEIDMSIDDEKYDGESPDYTKDNKYNVVEGKNDDTSSDRKNIFIGDSRCVGIQNAIDTTEKDKSEWICEVGEGYEWFISTATTSALSSKVTSNDKYNIIINLGVNDLSYAEKYKNYFNDLAEMNKYKDNSKIIVVSVNPIDDTLAKNNNYNATNAKVVEFNTTVANGLNSNVKYCNVYDKVKSSFKTTDGIHYDDTTSKKIYNEILKCL